MSITGLEGHVAKCVLALIPEIRSEGRFQCPCYLSLFKRFEVSVGGMTVSNRDKFLVIYHVGGRTIYVGDKSVFYNRLPT